jgi:4-hydroxyproline epimerase
MKRVQIVDSHTGGEPTRVVVAGGPDLGDGPLATRLQRFRAEQDRFRAAVVNEPRGSDVLVGALLCEPVDPTCAAGVIFFNNVGCLGMCGHGTIGLMVTLAHLGRIGPGTHRLETPVGMVTARLHPDGSVSVDNVPSHRRAKAARIRVPGIGTVEGDVAWAGNWFYLVAEHSEALELANVERLTDVSWRLRQAANAQGFPEIDHVELFGPPRVAGASSRSFVLCPGKAYDRSPCGTGTSAKLACLAADGKLAEGQEWVQESIIGSTFRASFRWQDRASGQIIPTITGSAFINAEATLLLDERDPFCWGIGAGASVPAGSAGVRPTRAVGRAKPAAKARSAHAAADSPAEVGHPHFSAPGQ